MTQIATSKILDFLLKLWTLVSQFAIDVYDVLTMPLTRLVEEANYFDFTTPFWNWLLNEIGIGTYTLLDFTFGAFAFFAAYTLLKWFTDVVA